MSKPETWKSWEGRVIDGKFPLRQYLGGSDHSAVFLTETPGPQPTEAAIKLIDPQGNDVERELARLRAVTALSHPNLMRTSEAGRVQIDGAPVLYIVMECADDNLAQILPQRALEPSEMAELLPPVIDALSYLHGRGFVHNRITPSNVLAVGNQLKLSGDNAHSARAANSTRRRVDAYDAPETAAGIVTAEGDIWSLGALLVAGLTQNVALVEDGSASKTGLPQNIPEPFRGIARECLHLDPKRRCSLAQIRARLQPSGRSVPAEPELVPAAPSGYRYSWRMFVPIAVLILGLLGWGLYHVIAGPTTEKSAGAPAAEQPKVETPPPATPTTPAPTAQPAAQPPALAQPDPPKVNMPGAVLHQVLPEIPRSAQNTISGTIKVVVHVQVDPSGKVSSAKFKTSGSSRYFANQAMKAAERWEFTPPQIDGQPIASNWLLQFRFKRTSIQASPQRLSR